MGSHLFYKISITNQLIFSEIDSGPHTNDLHLCEDGSNLPGSKSVVFMKNVSQHNWLASPWWRHQIETFSALLAICAGNSLVTSEFPAQRPVTRSFDVFFDLCLNKRLSKQLWGWWLEMPWHPLWRHCNATTTLEKPENCRGMFDFGGIGVFYLTFYTLMFCI